MADENIEDKVREEITDIIVELFGVSKQDVKEESNFQKDFGADSLDGVEFIMKLEEKYNIDIPDDDAEEMTNVGKVVDYVIKKVKGKYWTILKDKIL